MTGFEVLNLWFYSSHPGRGVLSSCVKVWGGGRGKEKKDQLRVGLENKEGEETKIKQMMGGGRSSGVVWLCG